MSQTLLDAAWRVETMVGRRRELELVKHAIYGNSQDQECRVVLIKGPGGIGKSRMLEEIQWRAGNPDVRMKSLGRNKFGQEEDEDWTTLGNVTVSDTLDLLDIRLTARGQMLQAMRDALARVGGVDFENYQVAEWAYLERVRASASFDQIEKHAKIAEAAFWQDFRAHAREQRVVLMLDTAERLDLRSSRWAIDHHLLEPKELELSSQQWLLSKLKEDRFRNTTLIIAGRAEEGERFFRDVENAVQVPVISSTRIELGPLTREETGRYFDLLAKEWQARRQTINGARGNGDYDRISRFVEQLARDQEKLKVLHMVTGGRPVLLSLYGDLIHESGEIPVLLRSSSQEIEERLGRDNLAMIQGEIEHAFVDVLFRRPGLRSDIMQTLARCPAGLDAEQLHFLLDSNGDFDAASWKSNPIRVEEISQHLEQISHLSIARPQMSNLGQSGEGSVIQRSRVRPEWDDTSVRNRLILQDEIYRIYAQCMAEPNDRRDYENQQRKVQFHKLSRWAEARLKEGRTQLRIYQQEDERRIADAIRLPTQALRPYIAPPTIAEQEERAAVQQRIWDWELEKLRYELLRDPAAGLNEDYTDLTEQRWLASNEEADFVAQQEMWRVLHDDHALRFTDYDRDQIERFQYAAKEEDPTRWIKRFVLRRKYDRAVEFCDAVDQKIGLEAYEQRRSWDRPINAGERHIWRSYALIMRGKDVKKVLEQLDKKLKELVDLARQAEAMVNGKSEGSNDIVGEMAKIRLYRVIGAGYNFAGYGYAAASGQFDRAVRTYVTADAFNRKTRSTAQQAAIRNNLARALASLGREERGHRVCADALELRRSLGAEIPVAYSLNTLALIDNAMQRIPTAWRQSAQAAAIFRQAGDNRGLGLALIQLGIGLRRLANSRETIGVMEATPAELYATAQTALGEAIGIFKDTPEVLRTVEATLEMGCVLRDQMRLIDPETATPHEERRLKRLYRDAEIEFDHAISTANHHGFAYLALQALVDLAWTHYYAGQFDAVEPAVQKAKKEIPSAYFVTDMGGPSPEATETQRFYQLAKLEGLRGGIGMMRFKARLDELRPLYPDREVLYVQLGTDEAAKTYMYQAAEGYVLSLRYGQLFSPRSRSLVITFDQIYGHIKGFNPFEYQMFYEAQHAAADKYLGTKGTPGAVLSGGQPFDFSDLEAWLNDCFGAPLEKSDEHAKQDE